MDAQEIAREALEARLDWVHTTVRSGVTAAAAAETLDRLASDGWRLIIVADPALRAAAEAAVAVPTWTTFLLVGDRESVSVASRDGALETARYLAGRCAGARAVADSVQVIGIVARGDGPREEGFVDAATRGIREVCPACRVLVRGIGPDTGPGEDVTAISALFDAGAGVVFAATGGETALSAVPQGRWLVTRALAGPCEAAPDRCLTATSWQWAREYESAVKRINDGSWEQKRALLGPDSGAIGLLGFMDREAPPPGIPPGAVADIRERFDRMKHGGVR